MSPSRAQWAGLLAALVVCLAMIDVRYSAQFFGVMADASLAHLHSGLLLAIALLARDPVWLRVAVLGNFVGWQWKALAESFSVETALVGTVAMLVTYGLLRAAARAARWPAAGERPAFGIGDIVRALLIGSVLFPVALGVSWLFIAWAILGEPMGAPESLSSMTQTVLAKCFGVLILGMPLVVLIADVRDADPGTDRTPSAVWTLPVIGAALPMLVVEFLGSSDARDAALALFLDYRLIVAGLLLLVVVSLPLRASMSMLAFAQTVFAIGLAVEAGRGRNVAHVLDLARAAFELVVMQMLVLMTLVYNRERSENLRIVAEANAALIQRNQELQSFVMAASHDLQEPLRKIITFGERMREDASATLSPRQHDDLARIDRSARRMRALINGLLEYSRVSVAPPVRRPVSLSDVAADVLEDLSSAIEASQADIVVGPLPTIDADPVQIHQLLQNLIGNALRYRHPDRKPKITIDAAVVDGGDGTITCRLRVVDNGIGFNPEQGERIFGLFQRLHGRDAYDGTGLGLAIVRRIAEQHRGSATAIGRPGVGAEFVVTLGMR